MDPQFKVRVDRVSYPSGEHAFQAMKTLDTRLRLRMKHVARPFEAKRIGRALALRPDWELVKIAQMKRVLVAKFHPVRNRELAERLAATRGYVLVEGNDWNDTFWGACYMTRPPQPSMEIWYRDGNVPLTGFNHLGLLLGELRGELIAQGIT